MAAAFLIVWSKLLSLVFLMVVIDARFSDYLVSRFMRLLLQYDELR